jgi:hypothetical protein
MASGRTLTFRAAVASDADATTNLLAASWQESYVALLSAAALAGRELLVFLVWLAAGRRQPAL